MIARVERRGDYWFGIIEDDGEVLYAPELRENRMGCALRSLLNAWQTYHGNPHAASFEVNIDEW